MKERQKERKIERKKEKWIFAAPANNSTFSRGYIYIETGNR